MWLIEKLLILFTRDGFKLHNMVADKTNSRRIGRIVRITQFFLCGRIHFCLPTYYAVWNHPILFGSFVQTMPNPSCAHLISLHRRQAQPDWVDASKHKTGILPHDRTFKSCISGSKVTAIFILFFYFTARLFLCPV